MRRNLTIGCVGSMLTAFVICFATSELQASGTSWKQKPLVAQVQAKPVQNAQPTQQKTMAADQRNVMELIVSNPSLATLTQTIMAADVQILLSRPGPFTIFAPDNHAFTKLSPGTLEKWMKPINHDVLASILEYHIVPRKISPEELQSMQVSTINGRTLTITHNGETTTVNNAKILKGYAIGSNGIVYIVDSVLRP